MLGNATTITGQGTMPLVAQPMRAAGLPQLILVELPARLANVIKRSDLGAAHVRTLAQPAKS